MKKCFISKGYVFSCVSFALLILCHRISEDDMIQVKEILQCWVPILRKRMAMLPEDVAINLSVMWGDALALWMEKTMLPMLVKFVEENIQG